MRRKIGVLIVTLCMIFSMAVSVQAAPLESEEEKSRKQRIGIPAC